MGIKTKKKEGIIEIELNKKFYDFDIVKKSLKDFSQVCSGKAKTEISNRVKITLKPKNPKLTGKLGYEFCNYLLALMKHKAIV